MLLAKMTSKNQITIPKAIMGRFAGVEYFDVREEDGRIVLAPVVPGRGDEVRRKLSQLGVTEEDIAAAVREARGR